MIVECNYCEARVDAKIIAQYRDPVDPDYPFEFQVYLLACPTCQNSLLAGCYRNGPDANETPTRLWPSPQKGFSSYIPEIVRGSLEEANRCYSARAYSACAVMCGRSLEGICRYYKTTSNYLGGGLKELLERGLIDARLLKWSEALQRKRNIGAHATEEKVTKEDARDVLEFANAICEYVFVLSERFEEFMKRNAQTKRQK